MIFFSIFDSWHSETWADTYSSYEVALAALKVRAELPWYEEPNKCPCVNWNTTCGRNYNIIEIDDSVPPAQDAIENPVLQITSKGVVWNVDLDKN